jgi:hypothetical protein
MTTLVMPITSQIQLSYQREIPYPEQFANEPDYEQKSLLQDLRMKYVLCTRSDWINQEVILLL